MVEDERQASAEVAIEIEVTPEMIDAGVKRLRYYAGYEDFAYELGDIVREIYSDMASAKPGI